MSSSNDDERHLARYCSVQDLTKHFNKRSTETHDSKWSNRSSPDDAGFKLPQYRSVNDLTERFNRQSIRSNENKPKVKDKPPVKPPVKPRTQKSSASKRTTKEPDQILEASFQQCTEESGATSSFTCAAPKDDQSVEKEDLEQVANKQKTRKKGLRRKLTPTFGKLPKWVRSSQDGEKKEKLRANMTEVTESDDKVRQLENEKKENLEEIDALGNINKQLQTENIEMNEQINALSHEKIQFEKEFEKEKQQLQEEKSSMERQMYREIQQLRQEKNHMEQENQQLREANREKNNEIREHKENNSNLSYEIQQLQEQNNTMRNVLQSLRRLEEENIDLHLKKDLIEKEKQQLQEEKSSMESQTYREIQQLRQEKNDLEHVNQQLRDANRGKDNVIHAHEENSRKLSNEIRRLGQKKDAKSNIFTERGTVTFSTHEVLGRGGWADVYTGEFYGTKVAVKEYHEVILSPHNLQILEREINIASQCRHPNLLQMICATENKNNRLLIVTELMDKTLRKLLEQRAHENSRLEPSQVKLISLDIARGLNYLHSKTPNPIIHRDVSSANVLLWIENGSVRRAKISDYGSANFMQACNTANPGAALYAAPEARRAQHSPKIDVFSYGLLVCEMCNCELPLPEQDGRRSQIEKIANTNFRRLVTACTKVDPERRPVMAELIEFWEGV